MAFIASAYDTAAAKGVNIEKVQSYIQQALVRSNFAVINNQTPGVDLPVFTDGCTPTIITTRTEDEMSIPVFSHPVFVDMSSIRRDEAETYMVSDCRGFMPAKPIDNTGKLVIKNSTEYTFTKVRTLLSSHWYKKNTEDFKHLSPILTGVYASWVSEAISRRFALDAQDQLYIAILAGYYYQSLFYTYSDFDDQDRAKIATVVARATRADIEVVLEIVERFAHMEQLYDFCEAVKAVTDNPRLDEFNTALLVTMIATSWFGMNAREIAAVSLEHVPTFVMMIYSCFTDRSYNRTPLAKIAEKYKGNKGADSFVLSLKSLISRI